MSDYKPPGVMPPEPYQCYDCMGFFTGPHLCQWGAINALKRQLGELEAKFEAHRHGYRWELWSNEPPPVQP